MISNVPIKKGGQSLCAHPNSVFWKTRRVVFHGQNVPLGFCIASHREGHRTPRKRRHPAICYRKPKPYPKPTTNITVRT